MVTRCLARGHKLGAQAQTSTWSCGISFLRVGSCVSRKRFPFVEAQQASTSTVLHLGISFMDYC